EAIQEIGQSANSASTGAERLGASVEVFTGAVADADGVAEKVSTQSCQVSALFERLSTRLMMTLRNFADADQRRNPRSPAKVPVELTIADRTVDAEIVEISEGGALVVGLTEKIESGMAVEAWLKNIGSLQARATGVSEFGQRLQFVEVPEAT